MGTDEKERENAMRRADEFLESNDLQHNTGGFDRTVIDKSTGVPSDNGPNVGHFQVN